MGLTKPAAPSASAAPVTPEVAGAALAVGGHALTPRQQVARSNAALLARGGRRIPGGHLQPDAAAALAALQAAGYADGLVAIVSRALLDAVSHVTLPPPARHRAPKSPAKEPPK